jgi:hypothetical protein
MGAGTVERTARPLCRSRRYVWRGSLQHDWEGYPWVTGGLSVRLWWVVTCFCLPEAKGPCPVTFGRRRVPAASTDGAGMQRPGRSACRARWPLETWSLHHHHADNHKGLSLPQPRDICGAWAQCLPATVVGDVPCAVPPWWRDTDDIGDDGPRHADVVCLWRHGFFTGKPLSGLLLPITRGFRSGFRRNN